MSRIELCFSSQQGLLATYLIPGCVGRGVRLGSESLSGGAGGVWKSGNLEFGNLEIGEPGNLEIWKSGNLEIWNLEICKFETQQKMNDLKIKIRVAQNVSECTRSG